MKALLHAVVAASVLATPAISFSEQTSSTLTRDQIKAELVQLEKAGYNPALLDRYYPRALRAAQARVAAQNNSAHGQSSY